MLRAAILRFSVIGMAALTPALGGCSKLIELDIAADPDDLLVFAVVSPSREVHATYLVRGRDEFEIEAESGFSVVSFRLSANQLVGIDGRPLGEETLDEASAARTSSDWPAGSCRRCPDRRGRDPLVVIDGASCAIPKFAEARAFSSGGDSVDMESIRSSVRLDFPNACACPLPTIPAPPRVGVEVRGIGLDPFPWPISAIAELADGTIGLFSENGSRRIRHDDALHAGKLFSGPVLAASGGPSGFVVSSVDMSSSQQRSLTTLLDVELRPIDEISGVPETPTSLRYDVRTDSYLLTTEWHDTPSLHSCTLRGRAFECRAVEPAGIPAFTDGGQAREGRAALVRARDGSWLAQNPGTLLGLDHLAGIRSASSSATVQRRGPSAFGLIEGELGTTRFFLIRLDDVGPGIASALLMERNLAYCRPRGERTSTIHFLSLSWSDLPELLWQADLDMPCGSLVELEGGFSMVGEGGLAARCSPSGCVDELEPSRERFGVEELTRFEALDFGTRVVLTPSAAFLLDDGFRALETHAVASTVRAIVDTGEALLVFRDRQLDILEAEVIETHSPTLPVGLVTGTRDSVRAGAALTGFDGAFWLSRISWPGLTTEEIRSAGSEASCEPTGVAEVGPDHFAVTCSDQRLLVVRDGEVEPVEVGWDDPNTVEVEQPIHPHFVCGGARTTAQLWDSVSGGLGGSLAVGCLMTTVEIDAYSSRPRADRIFLPATKRERVGVAFSECADVRAVLLDGQVRGEEETGRLVWLLPGEREPRLEDDSGNVATASPAGLESKSPRYLLRSKEGLYAVFESSAHLVGGGRRARLDPARVTAAAPRADGVLLGTSDGYAFEVSPAGR